MATKKIAKPCSAVTLYQDAQPVPDNPHTWLHLEGSDAPISEARFLFGVLRPVYREWENSATAFCRRKLQPVPAADGNPLGITAERAEVLLPQKADDRFLDPWQLLRSCDEERPDKLSSLLAYVTISEPSTERLHEQWSRGHSWARRHIVDKYDAPVLLVQHAPHRQANPNPPHLHCQILGPRRLTSLGWSAPVTNLCHDRGRAILLATWQEHCRTY